MLLKADVLLPALAGVVLLSAAGATLLTREAPAPTGDSVTGPETGTGFPLRGKTFHDFGEVEISGVSERLRYSFQLTNVSDTPVAITRITSSCGCTNTLLDRDLVEPGQTVTASCELELSDSGERTARISLGTDSADRPIVNLHLRAWGRRLQQLSTLTRYLELHPGQSADITLIALKYTDDDPPLTPLLETPPGVATEFGQWTLIETIDQPMRLPARWEGNLIVSWTDEESIPATPLTEMKVSLPEGPPMIIRLRLDVRRIGEDA